MWHYRKGLEMEKKKKLPDDVLAYIRNFFTDEILFYQRFLLYPSRAVRNGELLFENLRGMWIGSGRGQIRAIMRVK